jgi:5'-phosphate synthase pdxT subunit
MVSGRPRGEAASDAVARPIGVLALQGAVEPHLQKYAELRIPTRRVRVPADLDDLAGIVLPGGESTTMLHLLERNALWEPLERFLAEKPAFGVCAGAILLARKVESPAQRSFGVVDLEVVRNGYGRQVDSFIDRVEPADESAEAAPEAQEGVFIRAPRFVRWGRTVAPLFRCRGEVVAVRDGLAIAAAFHPELSPGNGLHRYFAEMCGLVPSQGTDRRPGR